jgi:hypothetical protein
MEDLKTLFCASKFSRARERISSKFTDNLGARPQKGSPTLSLGEIFIDNEKDVRLTTVGFATFSTLTDQPRSDVTHRLAD